MHEYHQRPEYPPIEQDLRDLEQELAEKRVRSTFKLILGGGIASLWGGLAALGAATLIPGPPCPVGTDWGNCPPAPLSVLVNLGVATPLLFLGVGLLVYALVYALAHFD